MSVVDDIKDKLDVVAVIGEYVTLQKTGRNFKGLCPFHPEKTPSFIVSQERQNWHCFGCGVGGDVFSFVMKKDGLEFGEAVKLLADKAGVTLSQNYGDQAKDKEYQKLYEVNEAAAQYYHHMLVDTPAGKAALKYLEERGVDRKTIDDFQLGYSLDSWDALQKYLTGRNVSELESVGLVVKKEDSAYDMFRGRIMFPIRNRRGSVLGFGGRVMGKDGPKYLNSPQTKIFNKSNIIYGIDKSHANIRQQDLVVIVEGYMDVLTAHQYGMSNVVAFMGTAITESQIDALSRLTGNIVLALDSDAAGNEAALRGIEVCRQALEHRKSKKPAKPGTDNPIQMDIRIVTLPSGKDPDEIIREDVELWKKAVDESLPVVEYLFKVVAAKYDLTKTKERSAAAQKLIPIINEMSDDIQREIYIKKLGELLGISETTLTVMATRVSAAKTNAQPKQQALKSKGDKLEEHCLSLLLNNPYLHDKCAELSEQYFSHPDNQYIYVIWRDNPESFRDLIDVNMQDHLEFLMAMVLPPVAEEHDRKKELDACVARLEAEYCKVQQQEYSEMYDEGYLKSEEAEQKVAEVVGNLKKIQLNQKIKHE
ncbi:DNA primase [Chloroflexota bacterium]